MIRHLIFDLDGTLVDSCTTCVEILSGMLAERDTDHVIDPVKARPWMSLGGLQMVEALLGPACGDPAVELKEFRSRYSGVTTSETALFPGVAESLRVLRDAGFTLSICSNKPQGLCDKVLLDTGLGEVFRVVVGSRPGLRVKPAPDLLDATLQGLGAQPEECLFIGDSELDHRVSSNAGIPFKFMTYGYAEEGWLPDDAAAFDCFAMMSRSILESVAPAGVR